MCKTRDELLQHREINIDNNGITVVLPSLQDRLEQRSFLDNQARMISARAALNSLLNHSTQTDLNQIIKALSSLIDKKTLKYIKRERKMLTTTDLTLHRIKIGSHIKKTRASNKKSNPLSQIKLIRKKG